MLKKRSFFVFFYFGIILIAFPGSSKSEPAGTETSASLPLSSFAVPEDIGKVQERFLGTPGRTIIQLQDVHAHAIAQQNVAAILERLRTVFAVERAALEGAWVSTSLPKSHAVPTSREKQLLAGTLLEDDRITGPVYAAIMSPEPITLIGIEEKSLYEKNRTLFLTHLGKSDGTEKRLAAYGTSLETSRRTVWGPELLVFGDAFGKFRETSDLGAFFPVLLKTANVQNADASGLPQITLLRDIMALEKSFEKERLKNEVKKVLKKYKNRPWTLEELIRGGKIPPEEIGFYPEIKKLTRLYKMRDQVSLQNLMDQIGILTTRILEKLVKTPDERALWEKTERFYLSKRLLLLEATPADLRAYENERPVLNADLTSTGLLEDLALSIDFYDTVKRRDEIFFDRITNDPALAGDIVVVTGGFHTDGLSQRFRDAGISYITITPDLGGTAMNKKLYNERMGESRETESGKRATQSLNIPRSTFPVSAEDQTLSELRNAIAWIDERFPEALEMLFQTKDVRNAAKVFEGEPMTASKADQITRLAKKRELRNSRGPDLVNFSSFRESEFIALPRSEQLKILLQWMERGETAEPKAMLVSSVSVIEKITPEARSKARIKEITTRGDILALVQDVEVAQTPEILLSTRGVERFKVADIASLIGNTPRFGRLAKKHPFAIVKNDYEGGAYVVLPERPASLILFRIVTLSPRLYEAAKNPEFLLLLEDLVSEILSRELPKTAA